MTGLEGMDPQIRRQYEGVYGPFVAGEYRIGDQVRSHSGSGEIIWSYKPADGPLTYVIDDHSGWPIEILANEVQS